MGTISYAALLRRHRYRILGLAALLSLAVRLLFVTDLVACPFSRLHEWKETDMAFFHGWARWISAGHWLSDKELHPLHGWHGAIAAEYARAYPTETVLLAPKGAAGTDTATLLWNQWYGGKTFHQEPLYAYLLAFVYRWLSEDVRWVYVLQLVMGTLTVLGLTHWTLRRFGAVAGAVTAVMAPLYGPFLFHEGLLLRESLVVFETVSLLILADRRTTRSARGWFGVGAFAGITVLTKLTFVAPGAVLVAMAGRDRGRRRAVGALLLGLGLALSPAIYRNWRVGAPLMSLGANGAMTFIHGNLDGAMPELGIVINVERSASVLHETNGRFLATCWATIKTQTLSSFAGLMARKVAMAFSNWEVPDNVSQVYWKTWSRALRLAFISFLPVAALGLPGFFLAVGHRRASRMLLSFLAMNFIPMLVFFPAARYRLPFAAMLIPLSGLTVSRLYSWGSRRRYGPLTLTLLGVVLTGAIVGRPLSPYIAQVRVADISVAYGLCAAREIHRVEAAGRFDTAAQLRADFLDRPLAVIESAEHKRAPVRSADRGLVRWYANMLTAEADAWERGGERSLADQARQRAQSLLSVSNEEIRESTVSP